MGRLERHLDMDAVARVLNKTPRPVPGLKHVKKPRTAITYRAVRRNSYRKMGWVWPGIRPTHIATHPPVRPNRSRKWEA